MSENIARYTMRVNRKLLDKLQYISRYEGRSANKQIEVLIRQCAAQFEKEHGEITDELIQQMYSDGLDF